MRFAAVLAVAVACTGAFASEPGERLESPYYALIGIGWSETAEGGPQFVWRPNMPGIEPRESMRIFKYLEGPDIDDCLAAIIDSSPEVRSDLAKMGAGTACGGSPEAIGRAHALWTSYGFAEALSEVARFGRRGEEVAMFLAKCRAARAGKTTSSDEPSGR